QENRWRPRAAPHARDDEPPGRDARHDYDATIAAGDDADVDLSPWDRPREVEPRAGDGIYPALSGRVPSERQLVASGRSRPESLARDATSRAPDQGRRDGRHHDGC